MRRNKILAAVISASMSVSSLAGVAAAADAANGVTTETVESGGVTTVTQTRESSKDDAHYYIGSVETENLTSVTVTIAANSGGSNVTGGAEQTLTDETNGIIAKSDYDTLFDTLQFMPWVSNTNDAREADITSSVKAKAVDGVCYLYAWIQNEGTAITVTSVYTEPDAIVLTAGGKTVTAQYNAAGADAYLAAYDTDGALVSVMKTDDTEGGETLTYTMPDNSVYNIKAFLWDAMHPVCLTKEKTVGGTDGFASAANVTLEEGTLFAQSEETGLEYIKAVDVDRLLAPSFEMHGLSAPNDKSRYGGWERKAASNWGSSADSFTLAGHSLGHWMSAAAAFYNDTGDAEILQKLNYAVDELNILQTTDLPSDASVTSKEYIGGCPEATFTKCFAGNTSWANNYWVPWYGIHKIYQGLVDAYIYTGNETAYTVLKKFADWAVDGTEGLTDAQMQSVLDVEYGGMNEIFALMYEFTGEEKYLTTARRFTHDSILTPLISNTDSLSGLHANTQIPKIVGAAELYEQDPETYADYKTGCENFWSIVTGTRSYAIGGNSIAEHFETIGSETLGVKTCESCNTYNMMRLTEHLFSWNHDSAYMDWYEDALYNHILGQQEPETGAKMYFVSLLQGHHRVYEDIGNSWWCCTGTGMENPGRYTRCTYYEDKDNLYVNLYMPNTYTWTDKGLTFKTETSYPYSDTVKMTVTEGSADAAIHLRAPAWLTEEMTAAVGDETYTAEGGGWLEIDRTWNAGDELTITIPMSVRTYYSREDDQIAYKYGPITLAAPLGSVTDVDGVTEYNSNETVIDTKTADVPYLIGADTDAEDIVKVVDRDTLTFKIPADNNSGGTDIELKPFYGIHHEFYTVYWNTKPDKSAELEKALNDVTIDVVEPDGQQDELGHGMVTNVSGLVHQGTFSGTDGKQHFYRDAWGTVDSGSEDLPYFTYNLAVDGDAQNYLYSAYWGSDGPFSSGGTTYTRNFEILIDDTQIAEQTINNNKSNSVYGVFYEIPTELTDGKTSVTVKLRAKTSTSCAGTLELRTTSAEVDLE